MSRLMDLELKRAFAELQVKMVETSKKIQIINCQIDVLERVLKLANCTEREINALPPGTRTYESVGRMFLLTDLDVVKGNLKKRMSLLATRTSELEENKEYLDKNLKESEDNIREMVQHRKEITEV